MARAHEAHKNDLAWVERLGVRVHVRFTLTNGGHHVLGSRTDRSQARISLPALWVASRRSQVRFAQVAPHFHWLLSRSHSHSRALSRFFYDLNTHTITHESISHSGVALSRRTVALRFNRSNRSAISAPITAQKSTLHSIMALTSHSECIRSLVGPQEAHSTNSTWKCLKHRDTSSRETLSQHATIAQE